MLGFKEHEASQMLMLSTWAKGALSSGIWDLCMVAQEGCRRSGLSEGPLPKDLELD